jgi:GTP-binding protein
VPIDPPTIAVYISVNDTPQAGEEGKNLTSSNIRERLFKEAEINVALNVSCTSENLFEVKGRGELQLGVLLETMRREGFELSVSPPKVVFQRNEGEGLLEPIEEVTVDLETKHSGVVIEKLTMRKGEFKEMVEYGDKCRLFFDIPTRGLLGYMGEFKVSYK